MEPGRIHLLGPFDVPGLPPRRHVRAYVPTRARASSRPLLFLFDGQNAFDDAPSFAGGWHAHLAVERPRAGGLPAGRPGARSQVLN